MGQCCSHSSTPMKRENTNGSRRLSLTTQPQPVKDLPPNVNQSGMLANDLFEIHFACVSVAGTYFQPSMNPFKGTTKYKTNQDSFFVCEEFNAPDTHYFGVLDGHGSTGHHASQFISKHLPDCVTGVLPYVDGNPTKAFTNAFEQVDQQLAESDIDVMLSGSTCTTCLLRNNELIVANCGDSRCVLGYVTDDEWKTKDLSEDHKPDLPQEQARIEGMNGRVAPLESWPEGPKRVWLKHEDIPGLAMSRSLGDKLAHSVGVSAEPEIMRHKLNAEQDRCLILASDGVWEFIPSEEAMQIVSMQENPLRAAEHLCHEAVERWQKEEPVCDDITALVLFFKRK